MLYPIALVAFIVLWVLDRLLIAYYYQKPPTYSTESTQATLRIMWYMPIFFTFDRLLDAGQRTDVQQLNLGHQIRLSNQTFRSHPRWLDWGNPR